MQDIWHRFTGPNANEPPRALVAAIIPGRGDVPGHLVLAERPVEKTELRRHADLISAAPDMLAALQEIKRCNEQYNFGSKLLRIVLPAIAKAEGRKL